MNKDELIDLVAKKAGIQKQQAQTAIGAVFDAISGELAQGGEVRISGFATFSAKERAAGEGRNPRTGEPIKIPAMRQLRVSPAKALKDQMNPPQPARRAGRRGG